ncbi:hypothetical protein EW146_g746 [Bondarzewia mesenterica]|uniref:Deacetylase sirtuin-type domain-containing protein n=1 Tax=Bondarzewia mesenterica TaxID=1095465 RepID=A0A4V6S1L0_9AGAM|nr:hypothetical protein EW146_g746 [Bondarzewia mesenterica]
MSPPDPHIVPTSPPSPIYHIPYYQSLSRKRRLAIYRAQVNIFISASEVVDIDEDILQDILEGFDDPQYDIETVSDDTSAEDNEASTDPDVAFDFLYGGEEISAARWSKAEVKRMLYYLKERGMASFIKEYMLLRKIPIFELLLAFGVVLCTELQSKQPKTLLYFLKVALSRELQLREKLPQYNTIDDAVNLIKSSRRILILTGAGISVSCGIPDFRSENGLYATLKDQGEYDLDDPQQMFDIHYFRENPSVFYSFAKQIYPSNFIPSPCHRFIKLVEDKGKLLRNYTQNIDTLETLAGVQNVLQCHGSFATASCLQCRVRVPGNEIETEILKGDVPLCKTCDLLNRRAGRPRKRKGKRRGQDDDDDDDEPGYPPWIMKPDITFFGEKLTDDFDNSLSEDREKVDLLIVIGTSLKVSPVSEILTNMPHSVPQILINKTPIKHINPDIVLLGNADPIIEHLCSQLNWSLPPAPQQNTLIRGTRHLQSPTMPLGGRKRPSEPLASQPRRVGNSHVWLFEGAEGGKWLQQFEASQADVEEPITGSSSSSSSSSFDQTQPTNGLRVPKKPRMQ